MVFNESREGIKRSLASRAPKQFIEWAVQRRCYAIGGAGQLHSREGEKSGFGILDPAPFVIIPGGVEFGHVGDIESAFFNALKIGQQFQPVDQGINVPMHVVEAGARGVFFNPDSAVFAYGIGADGDAAQAHQAIGNARDVDQTCGFEEGDFYAEFGGYTGARANGQAPVSVIVFFAGSDIFPADDEGK